MCWEIFKLFLRLLFHGGVADVHVRVADKSKSGLVLLAQVLFAQLLDGPEGLALVDPLDVVLIVGLMAHLLMIRLDILLGCCFQTSLLLVALY